MVRTLLTNLGVRPQKRFGQNFLVDRHVVDHIRARVSEKSPETILEIGPGLGALTQAVVDIPRRMVAVDVDETLAASLKERARANANLEVRLGDILEFDISKEIPERPVLILGSLPYRITTPILRYVIEHRAALSRACLITQWEVAEKIVNSPGKHGSALGVFVHAFADVSPLRKIRKGSFFPKPEVDSAYWEMDFLPCPRFSADETAFFLVVRTLYRNRRKMIRRALQDLLPAATAAACIADAGLDETARGETLAFDELDRLATICHPHVSIDSASVDP